jgi:DNA-binding HxlR family transcriptional regulator
VVAIQHPPPAKRHPYDQWSPDARALDLVGDKWTLLIVRDLASGPLRFVELQRRLPGISTEQLRSRLNRMVADGMLTRRRFREVPPRVEYELTERARDLMPVIGALALWGYEWIWTGPRASEQIDIGAIFRLAPGLLHPPRELVGTLELTVEDGQEGEPVRYALNAGGGAVRIEQAPAPHARARITGPIAAWVRAFSPIGERSGLRISGEREFANRLLDGLAPPLQVATHTSGINAA